MGPALVFWPSVASTTPIGRGARGRSLHVIG